MADVIEFAKRGEPRSVVELVSNNEVGEGEIEINQPLIEHLEMWLEQARSGELCSGAFVGVYADGGVRTGWDKSNEDTDAIASGIMCLMHRYGAAMCD